MSGKPRSRRRAAPVGASKRPAKPLDVPLSPVYVELDYIREQLLFSQLEEADRQIIDATMHAIGMAGTEPNRLLGILANLTVLSVMLIDQGDSKPEEERAIQGNILDRVSASFNQLLDLHRHELPRYQDARARIEEESASISLNASNDGTVH